MLTQFVENLRKSNRLIAGGMFFYDSPGHMLSESDLLVRETKRSASIKNRSPLLILPPTPMAHMIADLVRPHGIQVLLEHHAVPLLREIQLFHPDLVLDVGQAHWKLAFTDKTSRFSGDLYPLSLAWALRRDEFVNQVVRYHAVWNATRGQLPLRDALERLSIDPALASFLPKQKYAVLQIKTWIGNGTVRLLDRKLYRPVLEFLRGEGYALVLGGREAMPEEFREFGVLDYANSQLANPRNDFFLFARASLGVVSPSGAGLFCDTLGIPCCQLGSWTLIPHPSERTLMVPSRLRERSTGAVLTFSQQLASFINMYDDRIGPAAFNAKQFEDIPPAAEEILAGVRETLDGAQRIVPGRAAADREKIRALDPAGAWSIAESRMSSSFLSAHPEYLA